MTRRGATIVLEFVDAPPPPLRAQSPKPAAQPRKRTTLPPRGIAGDSHRAHGTHAKYVLERCGCEPCRQANRDYERNRQRAIRRPDEVWAPFVPAGPVRRHLLDLRSQGIGHKTVADLAGLAQSSVAKILWPSRYRGMDTTKKVRADTAARILAVTADQVDGAQKIDAAPTWRLLDELIAAGWTKTYLAQRLGQRGPGLQVARSKVRASTARTVERLHAELIVQSAPPRRSRWSS